LRRRVGAMTPNTWRETLTRELHRFGHVSWLRRALEWCGVVKRETPPWVSAMAASQEYERELNRLYGDAMQKFVNESVAAMWDAYEADRARKERGE
jgi:hypothetical protein